MNSVLNALLGVLLITGFFAALASIAVIVPMIGGRFEVARVRRDVARATGDEDEWAQLVRIDPRGPIAMRLGRGIAYSSLNWEQGWLSLHLGELSFQGPVHKFSVPVSDVVSVQPVYPAYVVRIGLRDGQRYAFDVAVDDTVLAHVGGRQPGIPGTIFKYRWMLAIRVAQARMAGVAPVLSGCRVVPVSGAWIGAVLEGLGAWAQVNEGGRAGHLAWGFALGAASAGTAATAVWARYALMRNALRPLLLMQVIGNLVYLTALARQPLMSTSVTAEQWMWNGLVLAGALALTARGFRTNSKRAMRSHLDP